jgi:crotonobetainyl-CoA:carnitine CoA-transferase CaiB-like acyl-CoA transferase
VTLLIGQEKSEMAGCLDGVRVIDLGRYQAGPRCSMILGDLGAEVIKVEAAPDGDESRRLGMVYSSQYNRGKKSITLNLRSARGQTILKELVPKSRHVVAKLQPGRDGCDGAGLRCPERA